MSDGRGVQSCVGGAGFSLTDVRLSHSQQPGVLTGIGGGQWYCGSVAKASVGQPVGGTVGGPEGAVPCGGVELCCVVLCCDGRRESFPAKPPARFASRSKERKPFRRIAGIGSQWDSRRRARAEVLPEDSAGAPGFAVSSGQMAVRSFGGRRRRRGNAWVGG